MANSLSLPSRKRGEGTLVRAALRGARWVSVNQDGLDLVSRANQDGLDLVSRANQDGLDLLLA